MTKTTFIGIAIAVFLIGGITALISLSDESSSQTAQNNVSMIDGKQVIEITAKGGYSPRSTSAQANVPTVLKVKTQGTFDCSSALTIPALAWQKNLPPSGETLIEIPAQEVGTKLQGLCSMGMYNFVVIFS